MNPLVSIVMPVYNGAKYIAEAIESVLAQTYSNWELIIINDGSTDHSAEVIAGFDSEKIKVFHLPENKGIVNARNEGLAKSSGKYIATLDCDDIALPHRLATQVAYLEQNENCVLVGSSTLLIDENGKEIGSVIRDISNEKLPELMLFSNYFSNSSVMIRRNDALYKQEYCLTEDYQYFTQLARIGKLVNLPEILVKYRVYATSSSAVKKEEVSEKVKLILKQQLATIPIAFSDDELKLHSALVNGPFESTVLHLEKVQAWLQRLLKANVIGKKYSQDNLRHFCQLFLLRHCIHSRLGTRAIVFYLKSPFYKVDLQLIKPELKLIFNRFISTSPH